MFQRVMESILQGVPGVIVYIDDILVSEKTVDEHLQNLDTTLTKLEEAGLLLKRLKCSFLLPSVEYLGYKISKKGLQPIEDKRRFTAEVLFRTCELLRKISTGSVHGSHASLQIALERYTVELG